MITIAESDKPTVAELDDLASVALTRAAGDDNERQAITRRNLDEFRAMNNVSMMGGWT
ncbi:hypothetical protein [Actinomadura sp. KC06]|uniref:hypothetical protein n=1 Tax=Actinomadura sp. KC06 TaxID=2530369 RepID=UPI001404893A|nr:hypothetical protein [Actinomadura sp. KC06]